MHVPILYSSSRQTTKERSVQHTINNKVYLILSNVMIREDTIHLPRDAL